VPILQLLTPTRYYLLTPLLVYINTGIFLIMVLTGPGFLTFDMNHWANFLGANVGFLTLDGQWWRLITSVFIHGGLLHLLFNSLVLLNVGMYLEPVVGRWLYSLLYVFAGIFASLTSVWWHPNGASVGASGAIFGLYGVFLALLTSNIFPPDVRKAFLKGTLVFVLINLGIGYMIPMIDNAAHIGGLISGIVMGFMLLPLIRSRLQRLIREGRIRMHQT